MVQALGAWRESSGEAPPGLEGLPAGWPGLGSPEVPGPHGPARRDSAPSAQSRAEPVSSSLLKCALRCCLLWGGGPSPSSSLALSSAPAVCPLSPCPGRSLPCSTLSRSWGPLLGHHQCQPLWAWMGRRSWNSLPMGSFPPKHRLPSDNSPGCWSVGVQILEFHCFFCAGPTHERLKLAVSVASVAVPTTRLRGLCDCPPGTEEAGQRAPWAPLPGALTQERHTALPSCQAPTLV